MVFSGCSRKNTATPRVALQQYLDCRTQKDINCLYGLLPEVFIATASDAAHDIVATKNCVKDRESLVKLAKKVHLNKSLLNVKNGRDILAYAMHFKKGKLPGFIGGVRHRVKRIVKRDRGYIGMTYGGERYYIKKDPQGRYRIVPSNVIKARINRLGASAALMRRLADELSICRKQAR